MDMKELYQKLQSSSSVRDAAGSAEARKLLRSLDASGLEQAAQRGDAEALRGYLAQVLSTPEGQALARRLRKAVGENG